MTFVFMAIGLAFAACEWWYTAFAMVAIALLLADERRSNT